MPHSSFFTPSSLPSSEPSCDEEGSGGGGTERVLDDVERCIERAAALLHSLGSKYHRAAWLLEDTLAFVSAIECDGGEFGEGGELAAEHTLVKLLG